MTDECVVVTFETEEGGKAFYVSCQDRLLAPQRGGGMAVTVAELTFDDRLRRGMSIRVGLLASSLSCRGLCYGARRAS